MSIIKTQGLVLKHTNLNEADRILTILTKERGKIKAYAKGCRRPKNRLISVSQIFSVSDFILYKGSNMYYVNSGELRESFYDIREDLLRLSYAVYFTELADTVTYEDMNCKNIFLLLARTLYYLSRSEISIGILSIAYQIKLMNLCGLSPSLSYCVNCGKSDNLEGFSVSQGGTFCTDCSVEGETFKIDTKTLDFLKALLSLPVLKLNTVKTNNTTFMNADKIIFKYVQVHVEKKFKSTAFIDKIKNIKAMEIR